MQNIYEVSEYQSKSLSRNPGPRVASVCIEGKPETLITYTLRGSYDVLDILAHYEDYYLPKYFSHYTVTT